MRKTHIILGFRLPTLTEKVKSKKGRTYRRKVSAERYREEFIDMNKGLLRAAFGEERKTAEKTGKDALKAFEKKFTNYEDFSRQLLKATVRSQEDLKNLIRARLGFKTDRYRHHIADLVKMHELFYEKLLLEIAPKEKDIDPDSLVYDGDNNFVYHAVNGKAITFRFDANYSKDQIVFTGSYEDLNGDILE